MHASVIPYEAAISRPAPGARRDIYRVGADRQLAPGRPHTAARWSTPLLGTSALPFA